MTEGLPVGATADVCHNLKLFKFNWRAKLGLTWKLNGKLHALPRMAVCGMFIYISATCSYTGEYIEDFMDLSGYGGCLGDIAMDMLYLEMVVNDEETACGFGD